MILIQFYAQINFIENLINKHIDTLKYLKYYILVDTNLLVASMMHYFYFMSKKIFFFYIMSFHSKYNSYALYSLRIALYFLLKLNLLKF